MREFLLMMLLTMDIGKHGYLDWLTVHMQQRLMYYVLWLILFFTTSLNFCHSRPSVGSYLAGKPLFTSCITILAKQCLLKLLVHTPLLGALYIDIYYKSDHLHRLFWKCFDLDFDVLLKSFKFILLPITITKQSIWE